MSTFGTNEGRALGFTAGADLSSSQYQLVKMSSEGTVVLATAASDNILGVLLEGAKQGDRVSVGMLNGDGTYYVKAGAAITAGALLTSNASAKAVTASAASAGAVPTTTVIGTALNTVANADSLVAFVPHKFKY
jgi:hypothetical protein